MRPLVVEEILLSGEAEILANKLYMLCQTKRHHLIPYHFCNLFGILNMLINFYYWI